MHGDPIAPFLSTYLDSLVPPRDGVMREMEEEAARTGFPIIGPAAGYLCYMLTRLVGARTVFELGSGYGYSTAWFARAVVENGGGTVYHTVWEQELSDRARTNLDALGLGHVVQYRVSEAVAAMRETPGPFDVVFNDIEKDGYPASLPVIRKKLRAGGLLITDNLIWHARIFDAADTSAETEGVRAFTRGVTQDPAWTSMIVPIRDGLLVARRN